MTSQASSRCGCARAGWTGSASTFPATRTDTATLPLAGYYHAVHRVTLEFVASVTPEELERVIDDQWDPPVTASARLVSIIDDCAQHLGQAAYVRGIAT